MSTETLAKIEPSATDTSDELAHGYCPVCYPYPDLICITRCGVDATGHEEVGYIWRFSPDACIVCKELAPLPCKECGT